MPSPSPVTHPYISVPDRPSADEMDEKRHDQMAFQYLCRLEEARGWISEYLDDELPPVVEMEEQLRNGVIMARVANRFSPSSVPEHRIFDLKQERYKTHGLHFRHTDNIMQWIRAMRYAGLPEVFIPDTTDIYDKKNMPKAVFCLHALSLYLYRKGLAPPVRDVSGNVAFTQDEISMVAEAFRAQGVKMPPFGKIGGMLAEELTPDQAELHAAILSINEAVEAGDAAKTGEVLRNPVAQLDFVNAVLNERYQRALHEQKTAKLNDSPHSADVSFDEQDLYDTMLTQAQIQNAVDSVNEEEAMERLNDSLVVGTPKETMKALQDPLLRFPRVWPVFSPLYHYEFQTIRREKEENLDYDTVYSGIKVLNAVVEVNQAVDGGEVSSVAHALNSPQLHLDQLHPDDTPRYLVCMRQKKADKAQETCQYLTHEDIQACVLETNRPLSEDEQKRVVVMKFQEFLRSGDQSLLHEILADPSLEEADPLLEDVDKNEITFYMGFLTQNASGVETFEDLQDLIRQANAKLAESQEDKQHAAALTIQTQAQVRMWLCRRRYLLRLQAEANAGRLRERRTTEQDYQLLRDSYKPSLALVRRFATLIVQTEIDYEEELEVQRMKSAVVQAVRANEQLQEDINIMDLKIGLLVKNRLDLDEVLKHGQKLRSQEAKLGRVAEKDGLGGRGRSHSKASRDRLDLYETIVYRLQVEPVYLAKLLFAVGGGERVRRLIDFVVFPTFQYGVQRREEFLLVRLLRRALQEELRRTVRDPADIPDLDMLTPKIAVSLSRHVQNERPFREVLAPLVTELLGDNSLHVNIDPLEIYEYLVGPPPSQMKQEEAAVHPEVVPILNQSMEYLAAWTHRFLDAIVQTPNNIPYVVRYLAKTMHNEVKLQFPECGESDALKAAGHVVYTQYIRTAVAAPSSLEGDAGVTNEQRRKLGSVAKLLLFATSNRGFGDENAYLAPLNETINNFHEKLKEFFTEACVVAEPEETFSMDQYTELSRSRDPVVTLIVGDLVFLHQLLLDHQNDIVEQPADEMVEMLGALGPVPRDISLVAGLFTDSSKEEMGDPSLVEARMVLKGKLQIPAFDQDADNRQLFLQTKKLVLDVLMSGLEGATLIEMLTTPPTTQQELNHQQLQHNAHQRRNSAPQPPTTNDPFQHMNLVDKQVKVLENLNKLESLGMVSRKDNYQAVVTAIAHDIKTESRYRGRRKEETERLARTLAQLHERRRYQREQIHSYNLYTQGCLENLNPKLRPRSVQGDHEKRASSVLTPKSVKANGDKLLKKTVLREITDVANTQLKNTVFEFSTTEKPGLFDVDVRFGDKHVEEAHLVLAELLKSQYEGADVITVAGRVVFNVDSLIYFLNKKFYCS